MAITKNEILQRLRLVKPMLQAECNITELALFGSYARDEQNEQSDIDIMINMSDSSYKKFLRIIDILEATFSGSEVQVASRNGIKPSYFEHVKSDLIYA